MTLDKLNTQSLAFFFSRHQKQLHLVVVVLLSLYLLAFAARLIWQIIPEPSGPAIPSGLSSAPKPLQNAQGGVDVTKIQQLNLFGAPNAVEVVEEQPITDAPETKLNLTLTGVVASSTQDEAAAIIENRGTQNVYGLGEKIEGTNATLNQVLGDRVIIKNGIRKETLMLDGIDYDEANKRRTQQAEAQRRQPPRKQIVPEQRPKAVELDESITTQLRESPASFTDFISISPSISDGRLNGYQLSPGKKPDLFKSAGLKSGDIVIQINGLDLTDPQQAKEAMTELQQANTIELTLTRDGEYITLYLDMPEPGNG